jgi:hypothetical protein
LTCPLGRDVVVMTGAAIAEPGINAIDRISNTIIAVSF